MKKAWILLFFAGLVGLGLRYSFPKDLLFPTQAKTHVDEFLTETLTEIQEDVAGDSIVGKEDSLRSQLNSFPSIAPTILKKENTQPSTDIISFLQAFYEKLQKLEQQEKEQVRIAYFGDSMLDADMVAMQFRHYLQQRFGGYGVGFVPITSPSASGRYSIKHRFSGNWNKQSFLRKNDTVFSFGLTGETFFVGDTASVEEATVTYSKGSAYKELNFVNPTLFYGRYRTCDSLDSSIPLLKVITKEGEKQLTFKYNNLLNTISLPKKSNELKLQFTDCGSLPLYGVSFASQTGIIVDNLAVRGNSGLPLTRLHTGLMRQFHRHFDYDLVILSYGTNVFSPDYAKDYGWYGRRMCKVIQHLKNCFKNTDVLVVSMADRAVKQKDVIQTPPELYDFITIQKSIADSTSSAFFSLYDAMGGAGSMKKWAEAKPPLANKDYTHFNSKGAEKAGRLFFNWLMKHYEEYIQYKESQLKTERDTMFFTTMQDTTMIETAAQIQTYIQTLKKP